MSSSWPLLSCQNWRFCFVFLVAGRIWKPASAHILIIKTYKYHHEDSRVRASGEAPRREQPLDSPYEVISGQGKEYLYSILSPAPDHSIRPTPSLAGSSTKRDKIQRSRAGTAIIGVLPILLVHVTSLGSLWGSCLVNSWTVAWGRHRIGAGSARV